MLKNLSGWLLQTLETAEAQMIGARILSLLGDRTEGPGANRVYRGAAAILDPTAHALCVAALDWEEDTAHRLGATSTEAIRALGEAVKAYRAAIESIPPVKEPL